LILKGKNKPRIFLSLYDSFTASTQRAAESKGSTVSKRGSTVLSVGLGAAILYLGAHAVTGHQGLLAYMDVQAEERALEARVTALDQEEAALERRAARLRPQSLDLDYLDERARITLAAGDPEEIVFALD